MQSLLQKEATRIFEDSTVCNCKQVCYSDIADALDNLTKFDDVQKVTHCSTGCGGCHQKILDIISEIMSGATV